MSLDRVFFAFVIVLALTLNVGFIAGDIGKPEHHNVVELFFALVVSLLATVMKFGDRSPLGSAMLATTATQVSGLSVMVAPSSRRTSSILDSPSRSITRVAFSHASPLISTDSMRRSPSYPPRPSSATIETRRSRCTVS